MDRLETADCCCVCVLCACGSVCLWQYGMSCFLFGTGLPISHRLDGFVGRGGEWQCLNCTMAGGDQAVLNDQLKIFLNTALWFFCT